MHLILETIAVTAFLLTILVLIIARKILMGIDEIQAKLVKLSSSVDAIPGATPPVDFQPVGDAIDAIQAKVDAKITAPA